MEITPTIERYLKCIIEDEFHRFKSWDICYQAFNINKQTEILTLELAFYLASWGMYRGSSGLLQTNYLIHKDAVNILFTKESLKLKCNQNNEVSRKNVSEILDLKNKLAAHYREINFTKKTQKSHPISPTDTLLSKVLLGTLGCMPAYDRYFILGLKEMKIKHTILNVNSLNELFDFVDINKKEIENAQKLISTKTDNHYPIMKILDMYFWQIGYDKTLKKTNGIGINL